MPKKILLVEDYDDARQFIKMHLEFTGHTVVEALTGKEAVALAESEKPDIILMDVNLPEMDGLTATKMIRENPVTHNIPIIAVTANSIAIFNEALEAGCYSVLEKPVRLEEITEIINLFD